MSIFTYPNGGLVVELYSEYVYMEYFKISYLYKLLKNCASQRSNMINSKETGCSRVLAKQGLGGLSPSCKAWRGSVSVPSPEILHLATFLEYRQIDIQKRRQYKRNERGTFRYKKWPKQRKIIALCNMKKVENEDY